MGKFKNTFVKEIRKEQERAREQERLRSKHHVEEDILIVEKTNMVKFLIRLSGRIIRVLLTVAIFLLATVGLMSLVYPEVRAELFLVFSQIMADLQKML